MTSTPCPSCAHLNVKPAYCDRCEGAGIVFPPKPQQAALRGLVNAAMVIIGNAVDFNERRQVFICTVCRYRDPLGDEGTKLHADECPIYKLHAACDVAGPLIEPATWANAGATPMEQGATESAQDLSSLRLAVTSLSLQLAGLRKQLDDALARSGELDEGQTPQHAPTDTKG